ncbi:MAG: hypothetical protein JKY70_08505 [Mucilaginibacter sp.]|nr:hypothetical protein [Mucilaginibacter sp.]
MHWYKLFADFLKGDPNAIQAIFSMAGFTATIIGIIYISRSFKQQTHIYKQQLNLNRLSIEKHRRDVRPNFLIKPVAGKHTGMVYSIILTNAIAVKITIDTFNEQGELLAAFSSKHNAWDVTDDPRIMDLEIPISSIIKPEFVLNRLLFEDEDGRKYQQNVKYRSGDIYTTFPILLEDIPQQKGWGYKIFTNNFKK